jgi:hypothetical protein
MRTADHGSFSMAIAILVANTTTLVCCVLPAVLVSVGAGAVVVGLVSAVPQLIWLSEHKTMVFAVAGVLLTIGGPAIWWAWRQPCPADPVLGRSCMRLRKASVRLYSVSAFLFLLSVTVTFVLPWF